MTRTMIDKYQVESGAKNSAVKRKGGKIKFASKDPAEFVPEEIEMVIYLLKKQSQLSKWEIKFLSGCLNQRVISKKQLAIIKKLITKLKIL